MNARRPILIATAACALAAAAAIAWHLYPHAEPAVRLRPDDAALIAHGQSVYATHCASCHGTRLEGQPDWKQRGADGRLPAPPHDASGHTWHHPDAQLFRITRLGVARAGGLEGYDSAMPAYEGVLSDDDIIAVLSWIKAQWPADIRHMHDRLPGQAAAK